MKTRPSKGDWWCCFRGCNVRKKANLLEEDYNFFSWHFRGDPIRRTVGDLKPFEELSPFGATVLCRSL